MKVKVTPTVFFIFTSTSRSTAPGPPVALMTAESGIRPRRQKTRSPATSGVRSCPQTPAGRSAAVTSFRRTTHGFELETVSPAPPRRITKRVPRAGTICQRGVRWMSNPFILIALRNSAIAHPVLSGLGRTDAPAIAASRSRRPACHLAPCHAPHRNYAMPTQRVTSALEDRLVCTERVKPQKTIAIWMPKGWVFMLGRFHSGLSKRVTHWMEMPIQARAAG
jgi:hypothetical protein